MIDEICHACLFKKPDERCENYVKRMVGECKWPDAVKIMKIGTVRYKVADATFYPVQAPDMLIMDLEHIVRSKDRVCIHLIGSQQQFDQNEYYFKTDDTIEAKVPAVEEVKWIGYVRRSQGVIRKPVLFTYATSKQNREIPVLKIACMEWCRQKSGRKKRIYPREQPIV